MGATSRQERLREATREEIKMAARRLMNEQGSAALSLGGVARAVGLTTPALYRYIDNRDALVTELVVEAYQSLADTLEAAVAPLAATDYPGRFRTLLLAYREWALRHPEEYTLIHSTSVSGYEVPQEATRPAASRSLTLIGSLLKEADDVYGLNLPAPYSSPPPPLQHALEAFESELAGYAIPLPILAFSIMTWIKMHALVWQELHSHLPTNLLAGGDLYRMEVQLTAEQLGLMEEQLDGNTSGNRDEETDA